MIRLSPNRPGYNILAGLLFPALCAPLIVFPASESAQSKADTECKEIITQSAPVVETPIYQPPRLGAPKTRVGGGTRNADSNIPLIELLAPASTGLTMQAMPTLYWYLSSDYSGIFEFVVTEHEGQKPDPLFRQQMTQNLCAGFHSFNLRDYDVELAEGVTYQWSVVIVRDIDSRSKDIVGHATLERVAKPENIQGTVQQLAGMGLWYDAIEATKPSDENPAYPGELQSLLKQAGLNLSDSP